MALNSKLKIKKLDKRKKFVLNAPIILENKFKNVEKSIKRYFKNDTVENLHKLRIEIRKLRYAMEIFVDCYKKDKFKKAYKRVKNLQDIIGIGRDIDVLEAKLILLKENEQISISSFLNKIKEEKSQAIQTIKKELLKFAEEKEIIHFLLKRRS